MGLSGNVMERMNSQGFAGALFFFFFLVAQGVLLNRSNEEASADVPLPAYEKRASTKEFKEQQSSGLTNATSAADHSSLRASVSLSHYPHFVFILCSLLLFV
jgi:hypothetical protein